jgi:hypothetical protein
MSDFFLSHAGEEHATARALAEGLTVAGLEIWCDLLPGAMPSGQPWVRTLEEALKTARGYLILVPARGVTRWVRAELDYALNRQALNDAFRVVPLLTPGVKPSQLPPFLGRFQAVRLPADVTGQGSQWFGELAAQLRTAGIAGPEMSVESVCPFPGLESFDEDGACFFFGRDSEVRDLVARLGRTAQGYTRWLQIEGPSGNGKSSLAKAGMLPAVRRGWLAEAPRDWAVAVFRPGRDPVTNLAVAVQRALEGSELSLEVLTPRLQDAAGLKNVLRERLARDRGFLLLVDQFEELFTLGGSSTAPARLLDALITTALEDADLPFFLVTTIRSDFVAHFQGLPRLESLLNDRASRYYLKPMERSGLTAAVQGPARLAGLAWDPGLPERIVKDAAEARDALPLMGHVLRALWEARAGNRLTSDAYRALGYLEGALSKGADALLHSLSAKQQQAARRLLLSLVHTGRGTADTGRAVTRAEALVASGLPAVAAERLLARLSGGRDPEAPANSPAPPRLVAAGEDRVALVHDALLRHWKTLSDWLQEERRALERRDDLEAAAEDWQQAGLGTTCPGAPGLPICARPTLPGPWRGSSWPQR